MHLKLRYGNMSNTTNRHQSNRNAACLGSNCTVSIAEKHVFLTNLEKHSADGENPSCAELLYRKPTVDLFGICLNLYLKLFY